MPRVRARWCASLCLFAALELCGQAGKTRKINLRDFLVEASHTAEIEGADGTPFRLKATIATWDWKGKPAGDGTLEETWLRPGYVRRVITFRGQTWTEVSAGGGARITGDITRGSFMERRLVKALLHAVPPEASIRSAAEVAYKPLALRNGTLDCVVMSPAQIPQKDLVEGASETAELSAAVAARTAYCINPASHTLRVVQERFDVALTYDSIARLGEHAIGKEIVVLQQGLTRGTLTVTSLDAAPKLTEADFAVPAEARDAGADEAELAGAVMAGRIVKKVAPVYPDAAKDRRASGQVVLEVLIGKDGVVKDVDLVSSPDKALTEAAMYAVKRWIYQPYALDGVPIEVETTVVANFAFIH